MPSRNPVLRPDCVRSEAAPPAGDGGFALPGAIAAMVIFAILIAAGFQIAQQEMRVSTTDQNAKLALYLADLGAAEVVEQWDFSGMQSIPLWGDSTIADTLSWGDWRVDVQRVGSKTFFLKSSATTSRGGAVFGGAARELGVILRVRSTDLETPAALTTAGDLDIDGSTPELSGVDRIPTGWEAFCASPLLDKIGFLSDDVSSVMDSGGKGSSTGSSKGKGSSKGSSGGSGGGTETCISQVTGAPCASDDAALAASAMQPLESPSWAELVAMADHTITAKNPASPSPTTSQGLCDTSDPYNWGDPLNPTGPCGAYFPMIYFDPSSGSRTQLSGNGVGQGIFLFEKDFRIQGNHSLYGLILVKDEIRMSGTSTVMGAIIAGGVDKMNGTPDALYSSCAVERAISGNSGLNEAQLMVNRSFIDLSNLVGS